MYQAYSYIYFNRIMSLPLDKRNEVFDFIDFMIQKYAITETENKPQLRPKAGFMDVFEIKPDFDEPLACFDDYMPE